VTDAAVENQAYRRIANATAIVLLIAAAAAYSAGTGIILPESLLIAGKERIVASGKAELFDRSSIFEYSDGGADLYLDAGFTTCVVRQYDFFGNAKGSIEVAAYDMRTTLRSLGLFQTLTEGHTVSTSGNFETMSDVRRQVLHKNGMLMELVDKSERELGPRALARIATAFGAALPGAGGLPAEFSELPLEGKTPGSERYYHRNFLSRSYLPCVLTARYTCDAVPCSLFISQQDSAPPARTGMQKLAASVNTILTGDTLHAPALTAVVKGAYIIGVAGPATREKALGLIKACIVPAP